MGIKLRRGGQDVALPTLLTRVDMGCVRNGVFDPWVNEVEFVPSMYIEDHRCPLDALLGEQMVKITKQFLVQQLVQVASPQRRHVRCAAPFLSDSPRTPMPKSKKPTVGSFSPSPVAVKKMRSPRNSALKLLSRPLSVQWPSSAKKICWSSFGKKKTRHVLKGTQNSSHALARRRPEMF